MRERQPCVVLTGAGVSTESGIPDFRLAHRHLGAVRPAGVRVDRRVPARSRKVWSFYAARLDDADRPPSRTPRTTRSPSSSGAGSWAPSSRRTSTCCTSGRASATWSRCTARFALELPRRARTRVLLAEVLRLLEGAAAPACPTLRRVLKPDVVMFGELLPERRSTGPSSSRAAPRSCSSSARRSRSTRRGAAARGRRVGSPIVNRGPTALDDEAVLRIDAGAGETLAALAERLT